MICGSATATTLPRSWFTPMDWNGKDSAVYRPTGKPVSPVRSDPRNIRQWKKRMKRKRLPKVLDAEKTVIFALFHARIWQRSCRKSAFFRLLAVPSDQSPENGGRMEIIPCETSPQKTAGSKRETRNAPDRLSFSGKLWKMISKKPGGECFMPSIVRILLDIIIEKKH